MSSSRLRTLYLTACFALCGLLLASGEAYAQGATGKVVGRVVGTSGQPLAAAQVFVEGTNRGNITDAQGNFFINEVPAGLHRIQAQLIGFRSVVVANQRVLAGQTLTLNFTLEEAAIQVEAITVQGATAPVPRDQVSSKSIVTGETIDQLPLDNATSIILLQPGVINTNDGRTIRGSRPGEEAVYVDGILVRRYGNGDTEPLELPTNGLAQVDVTTGGFGARFGEAQSGVINYVTRTGGPRLQGTASLMTDRIAPVDWTSGLSRGELSVGGPLFRNLSFFAATVLEGRTRGGPSEGRIAYFPVGVDTTFRLATSSGDSVDVVFPEFGQLERGSGSPFGSSDEWTGIGKLSWGFGAGNKLDLSYYKSRNQSFSFGSFNPQSAAASTANSDVLTAGGYFVLSQSAERALALDFKASYQRDLNLDGNTTSEYAVNHRTPFLGFNLGSPDFLADWKDYPVSERLVQAHRSGLIVADSTRIYKGRSGLGGRQGIEGVSSTLRLNPYAITSGFGIAGYTNTGIAYSKEARWVFNGTLDWQANRYNRIQIGGDYTLIDIRSFSAPLYTGGATPSLRQPKRGAAFITDRLDLGDVVIDAGVRFDYFDANTDYPTVPGYVYNIPDSLKANSFRLENDPTGQLTWEERFVPLEDCGGEATASNRKRADGTLVCKSNWVDAEVKKTFSPRLAVSFPVTVNSTFRLSYGHNVQVPSIGQLFLAQNTDLSNTNTNAEFGRDVLLPRTVQFEAGYRQLLGESLVMDLVAYSKTIRNGLTYRILEYENPKIPGQSVRLNSLTNSDYSLTRGFETKFDKRFSQTANVTLSYSYVDAKGTGSDPLTYIDLISRGTSNVAILNNGVVDPPEIMLPLDQSRTHNFAGTVAITMPRDLNPVLADLGLFATIRVASGLPYTRLENIGAGITGPPSTAGGSGAPAEPINASSLPWQKLIDLKVQKGMTIAGKRIRAFADVRNPFNIANTNSVFIETGSIYNQARFENFAAGFLNDPLLDGNTTPGDVDIARSPEIPINKYALFQAEKRFGNGDGIYTVAEQQNMIRQYFEQTATNARTLRTSPQSMRLGFEINF